MPSEKKQNGVISMASLRYLSMLEISFQLCLRPAADGGVQLHGAVVIEKGMLSSA